VRVYEPATLKRLAESRPARIELAKSLLGSGAYSRRAKNIVRRLALRGRGVYDMPERPIGLVGRGLGALGGKLLGYGPEAGWNFGGKVSRLLGMGELDVEPFSEMAEQPGLPWTATARGIRSAPPPTITNGPDESIVIEKDEFVDIVKSTKDYTCASYSVNPGLKETFRWTAGLAKNFQNYSIKQCLVRFESQLTNAVASFQSMGTLMICAKTNSASLPPASQVDFEQTEKATCFRPNEDMPAPVEMNPREGGGGVKLIRTGAVLGLNTSINDYDSGKIFVATSGMPEDGIVLGRLYIHFIVALYNPVINDDDFQYATYSFTGATSATSFGHDVAPTKYVDTYGSGLEFKDDGGGVYNTVTYPAGTFGTHLISLAYAGTTAGSGNVNVPSFSWTNCTQGGYAFLDTGVANISRLTPASGAPSRVCYMTSFTVLDPSLPVTLRITTALAAMPVTNSGDFSSRRIIPDLAYSTSSGVATGALPRNYVTKEELMELLKDRSLNVMEDDEDDLSIHSAAAAVSAAARPGPLQLKRS